MGERKAINKYFPPSFDPNTYVAPKGKGKRTVRLMAPFTMRCVTCGEYTYKGKKFNARKETVPEDEYLGIEVFRFYIKCHSCAAEMTFKTDPKNTDYVAEYGCTRNFEPWREEKIEKAERLKQRLEDETNNPMKALENKTFDSKKEIEIIEGLDEIRSYNARNKNVTADDLASFVKTRDQRQQESIDDEIEKQVREAFANKKRMVKRIDEEEEEKRRLEAYKKSSSVKSSDIVKKMKVEKKDGAVPLVSYDSD